MLNHCCS